MTKPLSIAIVGATGVVGEKMREVLEKSSLTFSSLRLLATAKSAGKKFSFRGQPVTVEPLHVSAFSGVHIVLSSTPASVSREWSPVAARSGAIVIDNSSAWRMDPEVPLVVPEVNAEALASTPKGIVANPNCSTIQMVVALKPLHDAAKIRRIVVSTYQASSGKGATGLRQLEAELEAFKQSKNSPVPRAHAGPLLGNVIPHDWKLSEEGYSEEEWKMIRETRKILSDDSIQVCPTTVRVPVHTGHSESIAVEFQHPLSVEKAKALLASAPGIVVQDDYVGGNIPMPLFVEGRDEVFVGRIRRDLTVPHGLCLWVVADNLRKGAATNAVQIAEKWVALRSQEQ